MIPNLASNPNPRTNHGFDVPSLKVARESDRIHTVQDALRRPPGDGSGPQTVAETEISMRKEVIDLAALKDDQKFFFYDDVKSLQVIDLAALKDDQKFFFYDDVKSLQGEPHVYRAAYDDDVAVTEEIYHRLTFYNSHVRYMRFCWSKQGAPPISDVDSFISVFRSCPNLFARNDVSSSNVPAVVFTSHRGLYRATLAMTMGVIVLAHKLGFPETGQTWQDNGDVTKAGLEHGEFYAIHHLVLYLPNGLVIKQQVDTAINACSELVNLRTAIVDSKAKFDRYVETGNNQMEAEREACVQHLERYFFLICFNAYIHDSYGTQFGESFSHWLARHPKLYRLLQLVDVIERSAPLQRLLETGERALTADEYIGLDVLSSQMDVKTSNFRRVPGLPIYGMAQPTTVGINCVVPYLRNKKQSHTRVIWINLRDDLVVQCDGLAYCVRDTSALDEPIRIPGTTTADIEEREESLKNMLLSRSWIVYKDIDSSPLTRQFTEVLTCADIYEAAKAKNSGYIIYRRLPMWDDAAPSEQIFDAILSLVTSQRELFTDEDGPAFVFQCRTGKGRSTTAMAIAGLIICHIKGFPYGTKPGEEERVSLPNAKYTQGHYKVVLEVVRRIPDGHQVKREVDFVLNQCSDTMTPMHYHLREVIFVTYNKMKKAKSAEDQQDLRKRSLDYMERYIYLILFNTYLHCDRHTRWRRSFSTWMQEIAANAGIYDILDNLSFSDFEPGPCPMRSRKVRWTTKTGRQVPRGQFV